MDHAERDVPGHPPLVSISRHPGWKDLKEAFYNLLVGRAAERDEPTFGDTLDETFLARLAAARVLLEPDGDTPPHDQAILEAALFDLGADLGRYVFAKRVGTDILGPALETLHGVLAASGAGHLEAEHVFHRECTVRFFPGKALAAGHPALVTAWVAGVLEGTLEEVFNCHAYITAREEYRLAARLGDGRPSSGNAPHETGP